MGVGHDSFGETYAALLGGSLALQDFIRGDRTLWSRLGFGFRPGTAGSSRSDLESRKFVGSDASSILLMRTSKSGKGEHGVVTVTLSSGAGTSKSRRESLKVAYDATDSPAVIARKLVQRLNGNHQSWVRARMVRSKTGVILQLISRGSREAGFVVSAAVSSNRTLPSIRTTVMERRGGPPDLLTSMRSGLPLHMGGGQ